VRDIDRIKVRCVQAGQVAPDFEARTLDGQPLKLSELRGKVVLLDFWATWCGPCVAELPALKKLHDRYKDEGFTIVGVSFDRDAATARKFVAERQFPWPQIWAEKADNGPLANLYGVGGIPASFLIGADGNVVDRDLKDEALDKAVAQAVRSATPVHAEKKESVSAAPAPEARAEHSQDAKRATPPTMTESSAEAHAVLERTVAKYRALKSYQDRFHCTARLKMKGSEAPQTGYLEGSLAFAAPDSLLSKVESTHIYYTGQWLTRYLPDQRQYSDERGAAARQALAPENWAAISHDSLAVHPLVALLALPHLSGEQALMMSELTSVAPETRAGHAGLRLAGRLQIPGLSGTPPLDFTAFINEQTRLFEEISIDLSPMLHWPANRQDDEARSAETADLLITFQDVVVDAALAEETFAFEPGGARKLTRFGFEAEVLASPLDLLGAEAPPLSASMLDGGEFDLTAQRGRIVVVAFWATWCPGADALLEDLQALAHAHTGRPLTVVAVNRNGAGGEEAVQRVLAEHQAGVVHVLDRDPASSKTWHVTALPAVFLIDQQGVVAEACPVWDAQVCGRQVAALLQSEPLYTPQARAARRAAAGDLCGGATFQVSNDQPASGQLEPGEAQFLWVAANAMSEQDIDGDGELELILPGRSGESSSILKPSSGAVTRIPLPGLAYYSIQSLRAVNIDGETCWLCAAQEAAFASGDRGKRAVVRLYGPNAEILWTFSPEIPEGTGSTAIATAGDLDGDGRFEYAIGWTTYKPGPLVENSPTRSDSTSRLLILDSRGRLIAQEELYSQPTLLYVAPGKPGQPAQLLCLCGTELQRFTLQ